MQIIDNIKEISHLSRNWDTNKKVGFVPTMGALHAGHLSLVKKAIESCDISIVSIFVNPSQFGPQEDLSRYPKSFEEDYSALLSLGVDYIFLPTTDQMYPPQYRTWVNVEDITKLLCGASRPGHFRGVATIVLKLINLIRPTLMFMGEKDYQQIVVLETMLTDLNLETRIVRCPIVRDNSGLALSSRNRYLSSAELSKAPQLKLSLDECRNEFQSGITKAEELMKSLRIMLEKRDFVIDYLAIVDAKTLSQVDTVKRGNRLLVAVYLGKTRLIDNIEI